MKKQLSEMSLDELWALFPIILKDHNPEYKAWYETERNELEKVLGPNTIKRISHIGSSAVKGLLAKPTVDILLEIDRNDNMEQLKHNLKNTGWSLMSFENEPYLKMSFNKGYTTKGFAEKVYHLHVRLLGDWNELYFKDYLIDHNDVANEYARLKQSLILQYKHNRDAYTEAKSEFILKHTEIAKIELKGRYKPE